MPRPLRRFVVALVPAALVALAAVHVACQTGDATIPPSVYDAALLDEYDSGVDAASTTHDAGIDAGDAAL